MDALGNFKFIFWVATPDLLCAQPELDQTQTLCWRNSLSGGDSLSLSPLNCPWEKGLPWLTGVAGSASSGVEIRCSVFLEAPLVSRW